MTAPTSAYPVNTADLVGDFQKWADELGTAPSQRATMKRFRIGTDKARTLLATLTTTDADQSDTPAPVAEAAPDAVPQVLLDSAAPTPDLVPQVPAAPIMVAALPLTAVGVEADTKITPTASEPSTDTPPLRAVGIAPVTFAAPVDLEPVFTEDPLPDPVLTEAPIPVTAPPLAPVAAPMPQAVTVTEAPARRRKPKVRTWPVLLVGMAAFIAIWAGWVELGKLTGFGIVHPLPGIWDSFKLNTAITLPLGMDAYAAFALKVWFTPGLPVKARRFARWSTVVSLLVGMAGQIAYHLMVAQGITSAPWQITTAVSCLPVIVLGLASTLVHLVRVDDEEA
ncbi:ABC transporter permease [Catellatospora sp. KI3]|uniref:ABC transporter permease n=1 Tax=Catellatospora sp. KI3 TaxID=3041620 RepID=UPI002482F995|nr:ABC transporter permease [Catellatospora sp. KI3]MDI1466279.1 ABC transporter permease [Catellatospora sp. KI3]